jgi:hypothetical protein
MSAKWIAVLAALAASGAVAQTAAAESDWEYITTAYGWFPGVSTTVETPVGEVEAEVDFDEVLETLDIAFLGAFEARKGRLSLIGDLQYFDISAESATPIGVVFSDAEVDSQMVLFSAYATYAITDSDDLRVDVGGGVRVTDATIKTRLRRQDASPDLLVEADSSWADVLIAARVNRRFNEKWYGVAYADAGGFGIGDSSDLTWQVSAGLGYRFNDNWSAVGGYRHLTIDREFGRSDITVDVSGPFFGVQARF